MKNKIEQNKLDKIIQYVSLEIQMVVLCVGVGVDISFSNLGIDAAKDEEEESRCVAEG